MDSQYCQLQNHETIDDTFLIGIVLGSPNVKNDFAVVCVVFGLIFDLSYQLVFWWLVFIGYSQCRLNNGDIALGWVNKDMIELVTTLFSDVYDDWCITNTLGMILNKY